MSVKSQNAKKLVCYCTNYDLFYRALHFHQFAKTLLSPSSSSFDIVVTIISSLTDIDVLDLLVQDEDLEELLLSLSCPFVFHSGMNCPVVSCGFSSFKTKKSYSRHQTKTPSHHHLLFYSQMQVNLQEENQISIIVALNWTILYDIFFSTKHILHSIIILFSEWLTSHRLSKCAAFDRANCAAMQQLARKGISSWQESSLTADQLTPDFPSSKRLLQWSDFNNMKCLLYMYAIIIVLLSSLCLICLGVFHRWGNGSALNLTLEPLVWSLTW